jgi:hypothetical protein
MDTTKFLLSLSPKTLVLEVLDAYTDENGRKMVCVRAIDEKVFVGGDKWPVRTEFGLCEVLEAA